MTSYGKSPTVPDSTIAANVHETFDVHGHFGAKSPFDFVFVLDLPTKFGNIVVRQIMHSPGRIDSGDLEDLLGPAIADAEDVRKRDPDPLVPGEVDTSNPCHA